MSLTLETGIGVRGANSYVTAAFVTGYLTERGREAENGWSTKSGAEQDELCVVATDFVEKSPARLGQSFRGSRLVFLSDAYATGAVAFSGVPDPADDLVVGDVTYTFVAALTGIADEVLIGGSAAATASNLVDAISATASQAGVTFGTGTEANRHANAVLDGADVDLTATAPGSPGNDTALSGSPANVTLTAFSGGLDGGSQPLAFPRRGIYDDAGRSIDGIPLVLRQATAEYAVRAAAGTALDPDPGGGLGVKREKVGPLEVEYHETAIVGATIRPYPAADRLLGLLMTSRSLIRG